MNVFGERMWKVILLSMGLEWLFSRALFLDVLYSIHGLRWIQECDRTAKAEEQF